MFTIADIHFIDRGACYQKQLLKIFSPAINAFDDECYKLVKRYSEGLPKGRRYAYLPFDRIYYVASRTEKEIFEKVENFYSIPDEAKETFEELSNVYTKLTTDIAFIQQWFSLFIEKDMVTISFVKYPPILRQLLEIVSDEPYEIPEGKESFWAKAEDTLKYYVGLRLLL